MPEKLAVNVKNNLKSQSAVKGYILNIMNDGAHMLHENELYFTNFSIISLVSLISLRKAAYVRAWGHRDKLPRPLLAGQV